MASKTDLLKRERDDLRRLADHWKLQHDEHKKLNAKLAARVEELEAELNRKELLERGRS
jgi:Skp family chaperone for outer membrane proteins